MSKALLPLRLHCWHLAFLLCELPLGLWPSFAHMEETAAASKFLQLFPTLCDPIDGSPPGSPVPGMLQARTLEWVAISFSNVWKWKVKVKWLSHVRLFAPPWTAAYQAPPSMGVSRQEYWSGVPLPSLETAERTLNQCKYRSMNMKAQFSSSGHYKLWGIIYTAESPFVIRLPFP